MKNKFKLKGHMSFVLRNGWLSKGIIEVKTNPRLYWEDSNITLGVGTTMVKAIRFYLSQTGLVEEDNRDGERVAFLTELGMKIYEYDQYFEHVFTLLLMHYMMISNKLDTIWSMFFNSSELSEFTKEDVIKEVMKHINEEYGNPKFSSKSVLDDVDMIIKSYKKDYKKFNPENNYKSIFSSLELIEEIGKVGNEGIYKKISVDYNLLPEEIFAFIIYDNARNSKTITLEQLLNDKNNIGKVCNLKRREILKILYILEEHNIIRMSMTADLSIIDLLLDVDAFYFIDNYYTKRSN